MNITGFLLRHPPAPQPPHRSRGEPSRTCQRFPPPRTREGSRAQEGLLGSWPLGTPNSHLCSPVSRVWCIPPDAGQADFVRFQCLQQFMWNCWCSGPEPLPWRIAAVLRDGRKGHWCNPWDRKRESIGRNTQGLGRRMDPSSKPGPTNYCVSLGQPLLHPGTQVCPPWKQNIPSTIKQNESLLGFPAGSVVKNPPALAGDPGSIPDLGKIPQATEQRSPCATATKPEL